MYIFFLILAPYFLILNACQKEITVDLPEAKEKICVDGRIEPGAPPYVILTNSTPYFGPTDISSLQNMFLHNAVITVSNGINVATLSEYCTANIPDSLLPLVAGFTGVDTASLKNFNYCLYTTFDQSVWGETGKTYSLKIDINGKTLTSSTTVLQSIPLDSVWYKYEKANADGDSLGFVWAHHTDPPEPGNAYRWLAKRLGKDFSFIPPPGAAFDDKFINGQQLDFAYNRGHVMNSTAPEDNNEEHGYFKIGDTVIIKYCTLDRPAFDFFRSLDVVIYNEGNPFSSPSSVASNIFPKGEALGIWCGYGVSLDTVIFK